MSETDTTGLTARYQRDEAGNVYQATNRLAEITQTSFDNLNRPTQINYLKDNTQETLAYDPAGNPQSVANNRVGYSFAYDNLNRLTQKLDSRGGSLSFSFDRAGNILTKTTYQGSTTAYTYDAANRLVNLANPDYLTVNYQYDAAGRLLSRVMSSGAQSLYGYDSGGYLTSLQHNDAKGNILITTHYGRDRVGNIVSASDNSGSINYTLDALYRLTQVDAPGTANDEAFSYDRIGNRLSATRGGTVINALGSATHYYNYTAATQTGNPGYAASFNNRLKEIRLNSVSGVIEKTYSYDNEGRLSVQGGTNAATLIWDAKGRLATLIRGASAETYGYDPLDRRISRSGGTLGNLDYYLEGEHLESVSSGGQVQEKYFRGSSIDELVAGYVNQGGQLVPYLFQHDVVNSVAASSKPNGGASATASYFAFGETQSTTGAAVSRLKYTGREDDGTGLYYYRARYYDPSIGRFVSEDPAGFQGSGTNWYAYVGNNPVNANDPTGLATQSEIDLAVSMIRKFAPELYPKGPTSVTPVKDLSNFLGDPIQGYTDLRGNIQIRSNLYGDLNTPVSSFVVQPFLQTIAHEMLHVQQSLFERYVTNVDGNLHNVLDETAEQISNSLFKQFESQSKGIGFGPSFQNNSGSNFSNAAGGFVIYPNKPNTNQVPAVYAKPGIF